MWFDLTTPPDPVELADIRDRDGITASWMIDLLASVAVADLIEAHGALREPLLEVTRTAGVPEGTEAMLTALRDRPGPARWSALERLSLALHGAQLAKIPLDVDLPDPEDLPEPLLAMARSRVQQGLTVPPWSWVPHAAPTLAGEMTRWFDGDLAEARAEVFRASVAQGDPDTCEAYIDEVRARAAALRHYGTGEWRWTLTKASERLEVGRIHLPAAGTDLVVYRYGDGSVRVGRDTEEPVVLRQDREVLEDYRGRLDIIGDGSPSNLLVTVTDSDQLVQLGGAVRLLRGALDDAASVDVAVLVRIAQGFLDGPMDAVMHAWRMAETDEGTRRRILLTTKIRVLLEACSFLSSDHLNALCGTFSDADEGGGEWQAEDDLLGRIDERHAAHRGALAWLTDDQWRELENLLPGEADPETWWGWRAQLDADLSAVFSVLREARDDAEPRTPRRETAMYVNRSFNRETDASNSFESEARRQSKRRAGLQKPGRLHRSLT